MPGVPQGEPEKQVGASALGPRVSLTFSECSLGNEKANFPEVRGL